MRTPRHLEENVGALGFGLGHEELSALERYPFRPATAPPGLEGTDKGRQEPAP